MKTYSVEELFDIDAEEQHEELVVKVQDLREVLNGVDTAFAMCNICDDLTPQAREAIGSSWPIIQKFLDETVRRPKVFTVSSSNGELIVDAETGKVIECDMSTDGEGIDKIAKFDVVEWKNTYAQGNLVSCDILDLGYWKKDGKYEPPTEDWREDFRNDTGLMQDIQDRKEALAKAFGAKLREWLTDNEMRQVIARNRAERLDSGVCHSHDFCDANMAIDEVFTANGLNAPSAIELVNEVWGIAKGNDFFYKAPEKVFFVRDLSGRGVGFVEHTEEQIRTGWADTIAEEEEDEPDGEDNLKYFLENAEVGGSMALDGTEFERIR